MQDHATRIRDVRCADVVVGRRFRKDMGDVVGLARSIERLGLLQPIGVTEGSVLVFGERRLCAVRDVLKRDTIAARTVDLASILDGEYAENEVRKDFAPTERLAIAEAIKAEIGNRSGERTDLRQTDGPAGFGCESGLFDEPVRNCAQVGPGEKTADIAAKAAGFGSRETYERAKSVVERGVPELAEAMDAGKASIGAAAEVATLPVERQREVVAAGPAGIKRAAKQVREERKAVPKTSAAAPVDPRAASANAAVVAIRRAMRLFDEAADHLSGDWPAFDELCADLSERMHELTVEIERAARAVR